MKILIVGGGIAGLTLGALLKQREIETVIVERVREYDPVGYVLALWPLAGRILTGLQLSGQFESVSQILTDYQVCSHTGNVLNQYDVDEYFNRFGGMRSLMRAELINLLVSKLSADNIRMNTTVSELKETSDTVEVSFSDGTSDNFDMVVACDGLNSQIRELVFGKQAINYTGWSGWAWWLDPGIIEATLIREYWGKARFVGLYPAKSRLCSFLGMPRKVGHNVATDQTHKEIRQCFGTMGGVIPEILDHLPPAQSIVYLDFADIKLGQWHTDRVLLIGDAGQGILPTAGIGASMAMESASCLADELTRTNGRSIPYTIKYFMKRRAARVNRIQAESRKLANMMFLSNPVLCKIRDLSMPFYSKEALFKTFIKTMDEGI